jgi:hypothetical protein
MSWRWGRVWGGCVLWGIYHFFFAGFQGHGSGAGEHSPMMLQAITTTIQFVDPTAPAWCSPFVPARSMHRPLPATVGIT